MHVWDKEFNFPMVKSVCSVPSESQIDDCFDAAAAADDDEEGENDFIIHYDPSTPARGRNAADKSTLV